MAMTTTPARRRLALPPDEPMNADAIVSLNDDIGLMSAAERIEFAGRTYPGRAIASTSAGTQAAVMLHLLAESAPRIPVVFVDTGYHFAETYRFLEDLRERFSEIDVRIYSPTMTAARLEALHGELWAQDDEAQTKYGVLTKVEPMDRALKDHGAAIWLSGLRRAHSKERAARQFIELQSETLKLYPILDWTDEQVDEYMRIHELPVHPLVTRGYVSIGDWHSTRPLDQGMSAEDTRFNGAKRECGLHLDSTVGEYQI